MSTLYDPTLARADGFYRLKQPTEAQKTRIAVLGGHRDDWKISVFGSIQLIVGDCVYLISRNGKIDLKYSRRTTQ